MENIVNTYIIDRQFRQCSENENILLTRLQLECNIILKSMLTLIDDVDTLLFNEISELGYGNVKQRGFRINNHAQYNINKLNDFLSQFNAL